MGTISFCIFVYVRVPWGVVVDTIVKVIDKTGRRSFTVALIPYFHHCFQKHRMKCDKATGIIEMVMDRFNIENEGTYTVQIHDGKAKNQSSLVLIGDGTLS